jgi:predicted 3-demethylubiquinone-9 3-methyltransferase (glyoxalase superfamily)
MSHIERITPMLWFDSNAEEAARYYTGIFKNSRIKKLTYYTEAGKDTHGRPPGSVMSVEFQLEGQSFTALNGGKQKFSFNEAISLVINCQTQEEIDYYWERLTPGGDPKAQQCGWLKDRYGLSWQVTPRIMQELFGDSDAAAAGRVMEAMMKMKKLDIAALKHAHAGDPVGVRT